tara:strand:+ start:8485 stop:8937 length:453 start_codon:yes stop_codon:yes gene_type:complete
MTVELSEDEILEYGPSLAVLGATEELAERIGVTQGELEKALSQDHTAPIVETLRRELAHLIADKLLVMAPVALERLEDAVMEGDIRAIENVLDRSGFPRSTRQEVRSLSARVNIQARDFSKYVEEAGGDLDVVEAALSVMKEEVDGSDMS